MVRGSDISSSEDLSLNLTLVCSVVYIGTNARAHTRNHFNIPLKCSDAEWDILIITSGSHCQNYHASLFFFHVILSTVITLTVVWTSGLIYNSCAGPCHCINENEKIQPPEDTLSHYFSFQR